MFGGSILCLQLGTVALVALHVVGYEPRWRFYLGKVYADLVWRRPMTPCILLCTPLALLGDVFGDRATHIGTHRSPLFPEGKTVEAGPMMSFKLVAVCQWAVRGGGVGDP